MDIAGECQARTKTPGQNLQKLIRTYLSIVESSKWSSDGNTDQCNQERKVLSRRTSGEEMRFKKQLVIFTRMISGVSEIGTMVSLWLEHK